MLKNIILEKINNINEIHKKINSCLKISTKDISRTNFLRPQIPNVSKIFVPDKIQPKIKTIKEFVRDYKKQDIQVNKQMIHCKRTIFSVSTASNKSQSVLNKTRESFSEMKKKEIKDIKEVKSKFKEFSPIIRKNFTKNMFKDNNNLNSLRTKFNYKFVNTQGGKRNKVNSLYKTSEKSFSTSKNNNSFSKSFNYETYGSNNTIRRKNYSIETDETLTVRRSNKSCLKKHNNNIIDTNKSMNHEEIDSIEEIHLIFINILKKIKETNINFEKLKINELNILESNELNTYLDSTIN